MEKIFLQETARKEQMCSGEFFKDEDKILLKNTRDSRAGGIKRYMS